MHRFHLHLFKLGGETFFCMATPGVDWTFIYVCSTNDDQIFFPHGLTIRFGQRKNDHGG
jgi:hypothetical protein